jgi:hypothetical protein
VRPPSAFVMIVGLPPSIAATAELVVPRSMPTTCICISKSVHSLQEGKAARACMSAFVLLPVVLLQAMTVRRCGGPYLLAADAHCTPGHGGSHLANIAAGYGGATNTTACEGLALHVCCLLLSN